jgi:ribonuclease G
LLRDGEGLLLRTAASEVSVDQLARDIERLRAKWQGIEDAIAEGSAPRRLDPEQAPLLQILSALAYPPPDEIVCDDRRLYAEFRHHPDLPSPLRLDTAPDFAGRHGLAEAFDLALARTVLLDSGSRLTFDSLEAFTAIDVDLGDAAGGRGRADEAVVRANLEAVPEIARHLRLRGIGGAIVIDFISMSSKQHRERVLAALKTAVAPDPGDVQLLGWTRLGHVELTRRRSVQPLAEIMLCRDGRPTKSPITVGLEALRVAVKEHASPGPIRLYVATSVAQALTEELRAILAEAEAACGRQIIISPEPFRDPETFDIAAG